LIFKGIFKGIDFHSFGGGFLRKGFGGGVYGGFGMRNKVKKVSAGGNF